MEKKCLNKILIVIILSIMMGVLSFSNTQLLEKSTFQESTSTTGSDPSSIDIWSSSSDMNPLIPFENCVLADLVVDSLGNTYVTGTFRDEIGFGSISLGTSDPTYYSVFVAKYNPTTSDWDWAVQSTGPNAHSRSMTLDYNEGQLYVAGNFFGLNTFGLHEVNSTMKKLFVSSIDAQSGEFKDVYIPNPESQGTSNAEAVIARPNGGVYVTGQYDGTLIIPGQTGLYADDHYNAFVASISASASGSPWNWITSTACNLANCGDENGTSLTLLNGELHVLGHMNNDTKFGIEASATIPSLTNGGSTDVFVWSINSVNGASLRVLGTGGNMTEMPSEIVAFGEQLIVSGNFRGSLDLSGINVTSYNNGLLSSGFVGSLTDDGSNPAYWNWVRTVNGSSDSGHSTGRFTLIELIFIPWMITDIDIGSDNTIIVGGEYWGGAELDGIELPSKGTYLNPDSFVAQLSNLGDWLNVKTIGGNGPDGMTRVAAAPGDQIHVALDSDSDAIQFGDDTHYPNDRSVIVGSFEWDRDGDDVSDGSDQCEGFDDNLDVDNDQIPDGCDSLIDSDGDGVSDQSDHCPYIPGVIEYNGCPKPDLVGCMDELALNYTNLANQNSTTCEYDSDLDRINNSLDYCDFEPEDYDGWEDDDGCPDPDNDEDSINDVNDSCPDVHATANGGVDNNSDGCPDYCDGIVCNDIANEPGDETNTSSAWEIGDCTFENNSFTNCEEETAIAGGAGVGLIGGSVITRWIRPRTKGGKPKLDLGSVGDAKDAYDLISRKKPDKNKTTGGSDHYFKTGVERQSAMSTAADQDLDDYIEETG